MKSAVIPVFVTAWVCWPIARRDRHLRARHLQTTVLAPDLSERMVRNPGHFDIKHFANTTGARRQVVDALADRLGVRPGFRKHRVANVLAIVGHLVSRGEASRQLHAPHRQYLTPSDTLKARDALVAAVEPDELLFATLPKALGLRAVPTDTKTYRNRLTPTPKRLASDAFDELTGCYRPVSSTDLLRRTARCERRDQHGGAVTGQAAAALENEVLDPTVASVSSWSWRTTPSTPILDWIKAVATVVAKKVHQRNGPTSDRASGSGDQLPQQIDSLPAPCRSPRRTPGRTAADHSDALRVDDHPLRRQRTRPASSASTRIKEPHASRRTRSTARPRGP